MSKFRPTDSGESSSYSSAEDAEENVPYTDDNPISPLAMMDESSPEAWLGQFLLILEMPDATNRGTLYGAQMDPDLHARLEKVRASAAESSPLSLLDEERASRLRQEDWGRWWRAQGMLQKYAYSTLALSLLGKTEYAFDLGAMYFQSTNARIHKDAHYVICQMLGKSWPSYNVAKADLARLGTPESQP